MAMENKRRLMFNISYIAILAAWLIGLLAMLYFEEYWLITPIILVFIVLNFALALSMKKIIFRPEKKIHARILAAQTIFLAVWCPLLGAILLWGNYDWIGAWAGILVLFYIALGFCSRDLLVPGWEAAAKEIMRQPEAAAGKNAPQKKKRGTKAKAKKKKK